MIEFIFNNSTPIQNFEIKPSSDSIVTSSIEDGYNVSRKRYTRSIREFTVKWAGTDADFVAAEEFYYNTTSCGSLPFFLQIKNILGFTLFSGNVILSAPYSPSYQGIGTWEFTFQFREV